MQGAPLCQTDRNTRGKWNDIFLSNRAKQEESDSCRFLLLSESLHKLEKRSRAVNRFLKNGTVNFGLTGQTKISV